MSGMADNPYESPQAGPESRRNSSAANNAGTTILVLGLAALAYGALAFWTMPALAPNTGWSGRLPSLYMLPNLYMMGGGMLAAVAGSAMKSLAAPQAEKGAVPTRVGLLVIAAVVALIVAMAAIARAASA